MTRWALKTKRLITGKGEEIPDGILVIENKMIAALGDSSLTLEDGIKTREVETVMPGMWDCHGHLMGMKEMDMLNMVLDPLEVRVSRSLMDACHWVESGFTSIREPAGLGIQIRKSFAEGTALGPRMYCAGDLIGITGGHSDIHCLPVEWVRRDKAWSDGAIADGVPDCLRVAREQFRNGADFLKICTTGGVVSQLDNPHDPQFSPEEIRTFVEEARRHNAVVAAHAHGTEGIENAVDAGVHTIEHATILTEELCDKILEKGTMIVPTRYVIERALKGGREAGWPEYVMEKFDLVGKFHWDSLQMAIRKGIPIAVGTDAITSGLDSLTPVGRGTEELEHLVRAGMTAAQAIEAACSNGPRTLGPRAPKSGDLQVGFDADLLVIRGNPLEDIHLLQNWDNIREVIMGGRTVIDRTAMRNESRTIWPVDSY